MQPSFESQADERHESLMKIQRKNSEQDKVALGLVASSDFLRLSLPRFGGRLGAEQKNVAIKENKMTSHYVP
jgi:hypothetical protein